MKTRNSCKLVPYEIITKAVHGEPEAMEYVLKHFSGYIASLSMRVGKDSNGKTVTYIDEDLRDRLERKLIIAVLNFNLDE